MSNITMQSCSQSRDLKKLWLSAFFLNFGFGLYSACSANFATEVIKIHPMGIGMLEAVRELPGFLCVIIAALTMRVAEPILGSIAITLVAGGIGAYATVNGVPSLLVWSFVWSVGLHTWMPISSSITLNLSDDSNKGKRMGQINGVISVGSVLGMMTVAYIGHGLPYKTWFILAAVLIAVGAIVMATLRRDISHMNKPRMVWKPKFRRYYLLSVLEGARKQVFFTFAPFTLTKIYHTPLRVMAILMVINGLVNIIEAPLIGFLIDKIKERRILLFSYSLLVVVFLCYALIHRASILYVLFCLDNLLYLSSTPLTTYVHRIAAPEDLMPTLSMGVTMNHVAAVLVPLIGGFLWARFSYPIMFYAGSIVVIISIFFVAGMHTDKRVEAAA